jgi:hypothetical protein
MTPGKIIKRLLLFLVLAFAFVASLALVIFGKVQIGLGIDRQWIALGIFTGVLLFGVVKSYRRYWGRVTFWFTCAGILVLHLAIFVPILRSYPEFPPFWYVPILIVEASVIGVVCGPMFDRPRHRRS